MNAKQEIKEVVDYFLANDKLFTTVDVANKLKEKNLFIKHNEIRDEVRSLYHNHMVNNNYCRTIITVTLKDKKQAETCLYHPLQDTWDLDTLYTNRDLSVDTTTNTGQTVQVVADTTNNTVNSKEDEKNSALWGNLFNSSNPSLFPRS
jgi:hypothetical protein